MTDATAELEIRYCPQIDSALLQAIVADFDLTDPNALNTVHETLSALEAAALGEANRVVDATGSDVDESFGTEPSESLPQDVHETFLPDHDFEELSHVTDTKIAILQEVFPDFSLYDISYTLKKCNDNWQRALDSLLNQQHLAADSSQDGRPLSLCRGIDGFSEDRTERYRREKQMGKPRDRPLPRQRSNSAPQVETVTDTAWGKTRNVPVSTTPTALVPQYAPLRLDGDTSDISPVPIYGNVVEADRGQYGQLANVHTAAYQTALSQARAAYQRSRSNRLMGGAASYYSQLGRDHASSAREHTSAAADAHVSLSATAGSIDLHGVNVQDAVRISKIRVGKWWSSLGEDKINGRIGASTRAQGFTIITGIGRHSEGGRGKLGPAVKQALTSDGWRIELNSGSITVTGKAR